MDLNIDLGALKRVALEAGKAGLPFIEQALTAAISVEAGPFGLLVSPALNALWPAINTSLGLAPDTPPDQTADKIASDPATAQQDLAQLDAKQQFALQAQQQADATRLASQAQQTAIVALDEAAQDRFQRWWRPALAWGLGGLVLLSFALPFLVWLVLCFGAKLPDPPRLDDQAVAILTALLGITVAARSADKAVKASTVKAVTTAAVRR